METTRCPRCGSMKTEKITDDVNSEEEMTEYSLTSGRIERDETPEQGGGARYHCHECSRDFGSTAFRSDLVTDVETYRRMTREILFEVGGFMQGFFTLTLEKTEEGGYMQVSPGFTPDQESGKIEAGRVSITPGQWNTVVERLYEELFVLDWKEKYENPFVMDGQQWRLEITMEDGEALYYHGLNAYPVYWDKALELFNPASIIQIEAGS